MARFTSRKFLICAAAFLGSLGTSIAALHTDNEKVATFGIICAVLSAAIYAAVEAYVDGKAVHQVEERAFELAEFLEEPEELAEEDEEDEDLINVSE